MLLKNIFRRKVVNIFGILWFPILFIKLLLDQLNISISFFEFFDYLSLRVLYRISRGKILWFYKKINSINKIIFNLNKKNSFDNKKINLIKKNIQKNGFYLFSHKIKIPYSVIQKLKKLPVHSDPISSETNEVSRYKSISAAKEDKYRLNTRFFYNTLDLVKDYEFWEIISDQLIWETAERYLGTNFCLQSIISWSLIPPTKHFLKNSNKVKENIFSIQAQSFHYDIDWPLFLKFFICIDDAKKGSGPFEYALGTHINKSQKLFEDKRISQNQIKNYEIKYLLGASGTFAAADTIGFHRDGRPISDERTVLQLEFASFSIGNPATRTCFRKNRLSNRTLSHIKNITNKYPRSLRAIMS